VLFTSLMSLDDGEKEFLENLYDRYSRRIYKYHYVKLKNVQAAECAMMDTFVRLIQNAEKLMECSEAELESKINMYSLEVFLDTNRKQRRNERVEAYSLDEKNEEEREQEAISECDLIAGLLQNELMEKIIEEIKKLEPRDQQIMIYKVQFDMRNKDIAEKMGMNQSTVNTVVHRIYKYLRNKMEGYINA